MVMELSAPAGMASTFPFGIVPDAGVRPIAWRPGVSFGRYELISEIGAGAMGVVWAARDVDLDRHVALKLIRAGGRSRAEQRGRLLGEARAMARLSHANVVAVYDLGATDDGLFIAMEHLDGGTLEGWLGARPRAWDEVVAKFMEAGRGLAEAHRVGLVHRDFKPENVLLGRDGAARVADFGLALPVAEAGPAAGPDDESPTGIRAVTEEGVLVGTLAFMAPEQLLGQRATARSDQFGFCVALYEALYGVRPFSGQASAMPPAVLLSAIIEGHIAPPPAGRHVPRSLHRVVLRGLACEPDDRWPSMDELVAELELCRRRARRWGHAGRAIGALGATIARRRGRRAQTQAEQPAAPAAARDRQQTRRLQVLRGSGPDDRAQDDRAQDDPAPTLDWPQRWRSDASISAAAASNRGSTSF